MADVQGPMSKRLCFSRFAVALIALSMLSACDQPTSTPTAPAPQKTAAPKVEPSTPIDATPSQPAPTAASGDSAKPDATKASSPAATPPVAPSVQPATPAIPVNKDLPTTDATIGGKAFKLEVAVEPETRRIGMMGRTSIADNGGMVFVFPPRGFGVQSFWMKDCLTEMDILYLDNSGRILSMHEMKLALPRAEGQSEIEYERSLKTYSSRFPCGVAVEIAPGMAKKLGLKEGDIVKLDLPALKKQAK